MTYNFLFKLLLVGDIGVGKSCFMFKVCDGAFSTSYLMTIGVDYRVKTVINDDTTYKIQLWDTAGQERFRTITKSYYRGSDEIIVCYDTTRRETYKNVVSWIYDINRFSRTDCAVIIIGTKSDLQRKVPYQEAKKFADENGFYYTEISSKVDSQQKLEESVLLPIIKKIRCAKEKKIEEKDNISVDMDAKNKKRHYVAPSFHLWTSAVFVYFCNL